MARYTYGGQALIEGVLMRGRDAIAVALRHPDGRIMWATERLDSGFHGSRWAKLPFLRGLVVLYETLVVGTRWLVRSANLAAEELIEDEADAAAPAEATAETPAANVETPAANAETAAPVEVSSVAAAEAPPAAAAVPVAATPAAASAAPEPALGTGAIALMLGITLLAGIGIFFLLPLFLASVIAGNIENGLVQHTVEGLIRVGIFLGYLTLISFMPDIRRVFQYHGAEHMTIHALEAEDPLTVDNVRRYPTAHQRCGTEFLVIVVLLSIIAFGFVGRQSIAISVLSRVLLIPVIAAVGYEILRLGARHRHNRVVKALMAPGILVQKITTRQPTDDMIEVAIVSMERALHADGEVIPTGSSEFASEPLDVAPPVAAAATSVETPPDQ